MSRFLSSTLENYITDMDIAMGLPETVDLSSAENLRSYQAKMKQLYSLEKFAFVDENGLIYTSRGRRTDINLYNFDYKNISSPEISIKYSKDGRKKSHTCSSCRPAAL